MTTETPRSARILDTNNPYPGLRYFVEDEAQFFLGRDTEIRELIRRIRRDPLTVLFGISGLGKTSLMLAGVFPELRQSGHFPLRIRLEFYDGAGDFATQVIEQTRSEAADLGIDSTEPADGESLWEYFHRAEFWGRRSRLLQPVLVLDQFEEIFSLGTANRDPRVEPFVEELGDLIENRIPKRDRRRISQTKDLPYSISNQPYRVVLSMREDFLPELEAWHRRIPAVRSNRMRLRPMNGVAALKVVTQVPDRVSDEIATNIVRYVAKDEDSPLETLDIEPALLSVVCRELNRRRIAKNLPVITSGLLKVASEELLQNLYEDCLNHFPDIRDSLQKEIEDQLLTKSGMRDNVAVEDFLDEEKGITEAVLQELIEERLVRMEERAGMKRLELSHDRWTDVVATSRDERLHREELEENEKQRQRERAEAKAREERLMASRRKLRKTFLWSGLAAVTTIAIVAYSAFGFYQTKVQLTEQRAQLDEALNTVQRVNRDFGAIQESVSVLGLSMDKWDNLENSILRLVGDAQSGEAAGTIGGLTPQLQEAKDDALENFAFLETLSVKAVEESEAVASKADALQATVEVDPGDPIPGSVNAQLSTQLDVSELKKFYSNDLPAIQSVLAELDSMDQDFSSNYARELLDYLSITSFSVWTVEDLEQAFDLLDDSNESNDSAQKAVSHLYLAAIGLPDAARNGKPGNMEGRDLRQDQNEELRSERADNSIQITATLQALTVGTLNPRGRYNAMWYLSESDFTKWTSANRQEGCAVIAKLDGAVGASTQAKVDEAKDGIGSCQ